MHDLFQVGYPPEWNEDGMGPNLVLLAPFQIDVSSFMNIELINLRPLSLSELLDNFSVNLPCEGKNPFLVLCRDSHLNFLCLHLLPISALRSSFPSRRQAGGSSAQ